MHAFRLLVTLAGAAVWLLVTACAPSAPSQAAATQAPVPAKPAANPTPVQPTGALAATTVEKPAAQPPAAVAAPPAGDAALQSILEGAKKETHLEVWIATPNLESTQRAVIDAFKQRFGLNQLQVDWLPINQVDAGGRILTEAQAGRHSVDVVSGSPGPFGKVAQADLAAKVDWDGIFGRQFPGTKEAAERMLKDWLGLGLGHWDIAYVLIYNTDQLKAAEVPEKLEDLADSKWSGRVVINATGAAPFDLMGLDWGRDKTLDITKRIFANQPVYKRGTPAVIVAVGQGEAPVGVGQITGAETEKRKGAPIDWKPMPYVPLLPTFLYVAKNAPSPNSARLFTAWLATEGMKLQEEKELIGRVSDPNSFLAKELKTRLPNTRAVAHQTIGDVAVQEQITDVIIKLREGT
jgi:iron(III) transport system substrate-binding protein